MLRGREWAYLLRLLLKLPSPHHMLTTAQVRGAKVMQSHW